MKNLVISASCVEIDASANALIWIAKNEYYKKNIDKIKEG